MRNSSWYQLGDDGEHPSLEDIELGADKRHILDNVYAWDCLGLKHLEISILFSYKASYDWHWQVAEKIAELKGLTTRDLSIDDEDADYVDSEDEDGGKEKSDEEREEEWDYYKGTSLRFDEFLLNRLAPLRSLETLKFYNTHQRLQEKYVQWMMDNLPKLREVCPELLVDRRKCIQLQKMRHARAIDVQVYDKDDEGTKG